MPTFPDLLGRRYKDKANLAVGAEHVLDFEVVPAFSHVRYQSYDLTLMSQVDVDWRDTMLVELNCWWIPVFGTDAAETVNNVAGLKTLIDQRVPKIQDTAPGTNIAWDTDDSGDDDNSIGDTDTNLIFRPDRISLRVLRRAAAAAPMRLYNRREWLGWMEGKAFRTGNSTNMRIAHRMRGFVRSGVDTDNPGYIIWVLTIPPAVASSEFSEASAFPANQEFEDLDFLAPSFDPIMQARSYAAGDALNRWRRWAIHFWAQASGGDQQYNPVALDYRMRRDIAFSRSRPTPKMISPTAS